MDKRWSRDSSDAGSGEFEAIKQLQQIATRVVGDGDFESVLEELLDSAVNIAGADFGTVQLVDAATEALHISVHRGFSPAWVKQWDEISEYHGSCCSALAEKRSMIVEDIDNFDGFSAGEFMLLRQAGVRALQSVPLVCRSGKRLGMFSTFHNKARSLAGDQLALLYLLAQETADMIDRARTQAMLRSHRRLLETLVEEMPAAVAMIRGDDLKFMFVSPAYQAIAPNRQMLGKTLSELWPEMGAEVDGICRTVLETGEPYRSFDQPIIRDPGPDGGREELFFSWSLRRILLPDSDGWGLLIAAQETTRRKRTEQMLFHRSEQLRRLVGDLQLAEQRERRRLAAVLHDDLQQLLVAARFRLDVIDQCSDALARETGAEVLNLVDQAIQRSRSLTSELSPPILQAAGLVAGLEWLVDWMYEKHGFVVEIEREPGADLAPGILSAVVFESTRELLFNAVKHAGVNRAKVSLVVLQDYIEVRVSDDGDGFDGEVILRQGPAADHFGLFNIRERLDLMGGAMDIDSGEGQGTRIRLRVPREDKRVEPFDG